MTQTAQEICRVTELVPTISNEASGPSYSVVSLCRALARSDLEITLAVLARDGSAQPPDLVQTFPRARFPWKLGRSPQMRRWLRTQVASGATDLIHTHGLWMMPNIYPGWATRGTGVPLVVSPRGTLSPWALNHSRWVKRVLWTTLQADAIRHAACFHATAESELEDIRRLGFRQPVCIIPNGIDIPPEVPPLGANEPSSRRVLFLGRVHPKKGVDTLLQAWSRLQPRFPDWSLDIVGPDNIGHMDKMKQLSLDLGLQRVTFHGPLYGPKKLEAYRQADLYVLPTHSENFGLTVAEALAAGTPAVVTKGAPWSGLEHNEAGWWIDDNLEALVATLGTALSCSPHRLRDMGRNGRQWMMEDFSWDRIGRMMSITYQWIRHRGALPEWVHI